MKQDLCFALRVSFIVVVMAYGHAIHAAEVDIYTTLTQNVSEIAVTGSPGPLSVFGKDATPILCGGRSGGESALVAVAKAGKGRIVAFGHNGYFGGDTLNTADTAQLMMNAIVWTAGANSQDMQSIRIATLQGDGNGASLAKYLSGKGLRGTEITRGNMESALSTVDVLCLDTGTLRTHDEISTIQKFIENGGGCVGVSLGWGWLQLNAPKSIFEHPGNLLFGKYGICWADGSSNPTIPNGYLVQKFSPYVNAWTAIESLSSKDQNFSDSDQKQISATLSLAAMTAPKDSAWYKKLAKFESKKPIIPSPTQPVKVSDVQARLQMTLALQEIQQTPVDKVKAHPAGDVFPGKCGKATAKPIKITIQPSQETGWKSLGLYAAPGAKIRVTVPKNIANTKKFAIRIGCHTDSIAHLDSWQRYPSITRQFPVTESETLAANAFGGLLYFVVPGNSGVTESFDITVSGATASPYYVLGKTSIETWTKQLDKTTAPWGEVESNRVVLSIPTFVLKNVDPQTMEPLLQLWDSGIAACDRIASWPPRNEKWRYVPDLQISAGYMHSGYPIMLPIGQNGVLAERLVSLDTIRHFKADEVWGFFHEVGHNYQSGYWTTSGKGEVTCNWFALYVLEEACGVKDAFVMKVGDAKRQREMKQKYIDCGRDFEKLKSDPFLYLLMDYQLRQAFGWEPFMAVTASYKTDEADHCDALPKTDAEKIDQYMIRFSKAVGKNLTAFFDDWGVPISAAARQQVANLPKWSPQD